MKTSKLGPRHTSGVQLIINFITFLSLSLEEVKSQSCTVVLMKVKSVTGGLDL